MYPMLEEANKTLRLLVTPDSASTTAQINTDSMKVSPTHWRLPQHLLILPLRIAPTKSDVTALRWQRWFCREWHFKSCTIIWEVFKRESSFALLQPSIQQNEQNQSELRKGPVIGSSFVKDTAKVNAYFAMEQVRSKFPREFKPLWSVKSIDKEGKVVQLIAIRMPARDLAPLDGSAVVDARKQKVSSLTTGKSAWLWMRKARVWKRLTHDNVKQIHRDCTRWLCVFLSKCYSGNFRRKFKYHR